jgi:hypothetical protein
METGPLTDTCTCSMNPEPHEHRYLRPLTVAALVGRPFQTVDSWRKSGKLPQTGEGYGQRRVCVCCAARLAETSPVRWVKRARRRTRIVSRRAAA